MAALGMDPISRLCLLELIMSHRQYFATIVRQIFAMSVVFMMG